MVGSQWVAKIGVKISHETSVEGVQKSLLLLIKYTDLCLPRCRGRRHCVISIIQGEAPTVKADLSVQIEISFFHHVPNFLISHSLSQIRQHLNKTPHALSTKSKITIQVYG